MSYKNAGQGTQGGQGQGGQRPDQQRPNPNQGGGFNKPQDKTGGQGGQR